MREQELRNDELGLDNLFQSYRQACPEVEPSVNFMPMLWNKIEARHSFPFVFRKWGRSVITASAALCLLLLALNMTTPQNTVSYADALLAEGSAEQTSYTEAMTITPSPDFVPASSPR